MTSSKQSDNKVICRTPTPGKHPVSIPRWKFDRVRDAILAELRSAGSPVPFKHLPDRVRDLLDDDTLARLGSVSWHVTVVKLEMEVRGEIQRAEGGGPQRLVPG